MKPTATSLAEHRKAFAGFKTQDQVDAAIDRYARLATAAEARRDRCEFESTEYWKNHDIAMSWNEKARRLMPFGS